jgi:hypothetical protein
MARRSHSKSEIEAALKYAEQNGWCVDVAALMLGAKFIVHITTKNVGAEFFAYQVFGVLQKMQGIMRNRLNELWINVQGITTQVLFTKKRNK